MAGKTRSIQIISTKLNPAAADRNWTQLPRLISRLDDVLNRRIGLISAPAGFGKTTLAVQWLDHISGRSVV